MKTLAGVLNYILWQSLVAPFVFILHIFFSSICCTVCICKLVFLAGVLSYILWQVSLLQLCSFYSFVFSFFFSICTVCICKLVFCQICLKCQEFLLHNNFKMYNTHSTKTYFCSFFNFIVPGKKIIAIHCGK